MTYLIPIQEEFYLDRETNTSFQLLSKDVDTVDIANEGVVVLVSEDSRLTVVDRDTFENDFDQETNTTLTLL